MKKIRKTQTNVGALEVLESATVLLRRVPAGTWLVQVGGTALFITVFLYFVADMGRASDAESRLISSALGLAVAYLVMKHAHALFGHALLDLLQGGEGRLPRLTPREHFRLCCSQTMIHATMPWLSGLSLIAMLPFAWTHASYHNATILAVDTIRSGESTNTLIKRALRASHHAPKQNHILLISIHVLSVVIGLNMFALAMGLPQLARIFSGSENALTLNPFAMINSTVIAAVVLATWFAINPFSRACYALRCFHFVSIRNGDDLRAAMSRLPVAGALVALTVLAISSPLRAQETQASGATPAGVESFDRKLDDVLAQPEFRWRMPRMEDSNVRNESWLEKMLVDAAQWIGDKIEATAKAIGKFLRWLFGNDDRIHHSPNRKPSLVGSGEAARIATLVLIVLLVGLLLYISIRWWRQHRKRTTPAAQPPVPVVIDLRDESVTADVLPEDEWLRLARAKWDEGDQRLAIRALFLGTLARLGEHGWLAIAAGKTNGMYVRELLRQPRASDAMNHAFRENVSGFEATWYGDHPADDGVFRQFNINLETIRHHANAI